MAQRGKKPRIDRAGYISRAIALFVLFCFEIQLLAGCATTEYAHPLPSPSASPAPPPTAYQNPKTAQDIMQLSPHKTPVRLDEKFVSNNAFRCERSYVYNGKSLNCDSNAKPDGEGLRPVLQSTPSAVNELDIYQENKRSIRSAAYIGTLGLVTALAGFLVSREFTDSNGNMTSTGESIRNVMGIGGISLAGGSLIFALTVVKSNEGHLDAAVRNFNSVHPDHPIQLQFSTGLNF